MTAMFSKFVGDTKDSNKAELLTILEALQIFSASFHGRLMVESFPFNAISWVSKSTPRP